MTEIDAKKIKRAQEYFARCGLTLPERWEGYRAVWHTWHTPGKSYAMTWERFIERVIEIVNEKPPEQIEQRLKCMRPVKHEFTSPEWNRLCEADNMWQEARLAWFEASNAGNCAYNAAYEAQDAAYRARYAAYRAWCEADKDEIEAAHAAECDGSCRWDDKSSSMTFEG